MDTKPKTFQAVILRTDQPVPGTDGYITASELKRVAKERHWVVEPVPGKKGHLQAVATIPCDFDLVQKAAKA